MDAKFRVLVSDDNADMCAYIRDLLAPFAEVDAVADGRQALEALGARRYDLVLADVMMPAMDGFELLRRIRASPDSALIPVVLLSAQAGEEARAEGLAGGADDYLVKPFVARDLVARIVGCVALARELHDQLGQHLAAFALGLAGAKALTGVGHPAAARLTQLEALTHAMTRDARHLALELRPPELDDVGLGSAVETYMEQWSARFGVATEVASRLDDAALPAEIGTALYRIVQEALTNVAKHAGADQVSVILEQNPAGVRLVVEDNGAGFDVGEAHGRARMEGRLGLAGMHERAALLGGALTVESSRGSGTTVYVQLPWTKEA
jgi:signal transduction histidine kinase